MKNTHQFLYKILIDFSHDEVDEIYSYAWVKEIEEKICDLCKCDQHFEHYSQQIENKSKVNYPCIKKLFEKINEKIQNKEKTKQLIKQIIELWKLKINKK